MSRSRRNKFGNYMKQPRSENTYAVFKPTTGWNGAGAIDSPPSSMVSGENVWIEKDKLKPRSGLSKLYPIYSGSQEMFSGSTLDALWSFRWITSAASQEPSFFLLGLALSSASETTFGYFSPSGAAPGQGTWSVVSVIGEGNPGGETYINTFRPYSTQVYSANDSDQVFLFGTAPIDAPNGLITSNPIKPFVWVPNSSTYSQAGVMPRVFGDITTFDNSPIVWGAGAPQPIVQWPTGSDIYDWSSTGAGSDTLVDAIGRPTRAFAQEDQMILATTEQIWRGRKIGGPYRFAFSLLKSDLGMPLPFAAVQTPFGIFWLNDDYMVYRLVNNTIEPVGQAILQELRDTAYLDFVDASTFFSFDPRHLTLTLHYATASGQLGSTRAFTLHLAEEGMPWTRQTFKKNLRGATTCAVTNVGSGHHGTSVEENAFLSGTTGFVYFYSDVTNMDSDVLRSSQWMSGGVFTGDPERVKFVDEMKIDCRGDIASNITFRVSGDLGGAFATGKAISVSAQSNTSQVRVFPGVSGAYHTVIATSDDTGWEISRIAARAKVTGRSI